MNSTKIIVVDIDGTLSDCTERANKYLPKDGPKNWDAFYEACDKDKPIEDICELVSVLSLSYKILFCSGRRMSILNKTKEWIFNNLPQLRMVDCEFLLRSDGDFRHDTLVKPELLRNWRLKHPDEVIQCILEDRDSMVAMWRALGYTCLQVAEGNF